MALHKLSLLVLLSVLAELEAGQYVIGPYWSSPHSLTANIYSLCKESTTLCFTEPTDCLDAYPQQTMCRTIAALTNYLHGLNATNTDQYSQLLERSGYVRNETLKGLFLFGAFDQDKHGNQSVGVALGLDPALAKDPKIFYVCTKDNANTYQVFGSMWTFNDEGRPHSNVVGADQLNTTRQTELEYYACAWGENMDYVNLPDNFYASVAQVEFINFNDDGVKVAKFIRDNTLIVVGKDGFVHAGEN